MAYKRGRFGILNMDTMEEPPLVLLDGGIEFRCGEDYDYDNCHREDYKGYLFQYTLDGKGCFTKNGIFTVLHKNMGFLASMPEESRYWLEKAGCSWEFLYLHFDGPAALPFVRKLSTVCQGPFVLHPDRSAVRMVLKLYDRILKGERLQRYEGGEFLYRFLCALLREVERPQSDEKCSLVNASVELMEEEFAELSGIEELAERLGISSAHLTRSFRKEIGMPPIQYLTGLRIQAAINDLLNTQDNLEKIAVKNGFSNANYFAKVFRRQVGKSPTQYRRDHSSPANGMEIGVGGEYGTDRN